MFDASRFENRTNVSRSPTTTSSFIVEPSGQVFCVGAPQIGLGTLGMGAERAQNVSRAGVDAQLSAHLERRDRQAAEWRTRDEERKRRIAAESELSPRQRLMRFMAQREVEIEKMVEERTAQETAARAERKAEAETLARHHRAQNEQFLRAKADRAEARRIETERAAVDLRQRRQELQQMDAIERDRADTAARRHIRILRDLHDEEKARAAQEAADRQRRAEEEARALRSTQREKLAVVEAARGAIVSLKHDLKTPVSVETQRVKIVRQSMMDSNEKVGDAERSYRDACKVKRDGDRAKRCAEVSHNAATQRADAQRRLEDYLEAKDKQKQLLQQQAREQKQRAREAIAAEIAEKRNEHAEYVAAMRSLVSRRINASTTDDRPQAKRGMSR